MATIDMEQLDGVVGCFCTLLYPRRGQTEGTIVEDLGCEVIVQAHQRQGSDGVQG